MRQSIDAFLGDAVISRHLHAADDLPARVDPKRHATAEAYIRAQHELFFGAPIEGDLASDAWRPALGDRLREHSTFVNLLRVLDGRPTPMSDIVRRLRHSLPTANDDEVLGVLNGLCALISVARRREGTGGGGALRPFLQVGLHLWVRELRRMVCSLYEDATEGSVEESPDRRAGGTNEADPPAVSGLGTPAFNGTPPAAANGTAAGPPTSARRTIAAPTAHAVDGAAIPRRLRFSDDLKPDEPSIHLPLIQCRECRVTGWGAVKRPAEQRLEGDLRVFYNRFFLRDVDVAYLFPAAAPPGVRGLEVTVCGACGMVQAADVASCSGCHSERLLRVFRPVSVESRGRGDSRGGHALERRVLMFMVRFGCGTVTRPAFSGCLN